MFTIHGFKDRKMSVCVKGLVFGVDCGIFAVPFFTTRNTRKGTRDTNLVFLVPFLVFLVVKKKAQ